MPRLKRDRTERDACRAARTTAQIAAIAEAKDMLLQREVVQIMTGLSRSSLYKYLPPDVHLSDRCSRWSVSYVKGFISLATGA